MSTLTNDRYSVGPVPWSPGQMPPDCATLPELLDFQAAENPDAPALVAGDSRYSYRQLADKSATFAAVLSGLGVRSDSHVALLAPNIAEWVISAYGTLRLGVRLDTFNTWVRSWDLQHLLEASGTEVLIMVGAVRSSDMLGELRELVPELWSTEPGQLSCANFPSLKHVIVIGDELKGSTFPSGALRFNELMQQAEGATPPPCVAVGSAPALVLYTSGTTEHPKAVPLKHRHMIENAFAIGTRMGLSSEDRVWLSSPLFWSFGGANAAMATMTHGACLVLQERFSPHEAAKVLAAEQCTAAYLLPSIALALVDEAGSRVREISSLRTGLIIGRPEEVERAMVELNIPELCNIYGSTEVYGNCCVTPHTLPRADRIISQGPPLQGVEIRVVDLQKGNSLALGIPGEVQVRGRVTDGYLGNPEATRAALTEDGWYRTGDTGLIRLDGTIQFIGRHTDMIKTSGINVSPSEVEGFIATHPAVAEVAVVGAPHPARGEVAVAFVVLTPGLNTSGDELREYCKKSLAGFKVPWTVQVIDEISRTPTGKMMRKDLREPAAKVVDSLMNV
ncbi:fatty-acyl-CoA synthase [Arthrobacter sp. V1I7]|uniref:class I adenylate-forming enzyme family protein n=1 Tax=Arthrobacter sp. V1I7 TaxID=3042274 RepID=UPI002784D8AA|nr:AMP-binding protein [Arthrobacter sp. V1I7]MDQ0823757.1 fatty-acyl-CoA synthase [Arthrobacter sp. V1I7]